MFDNEKDIRECRECGNEIERREMTFVRDRYGIPYKLVCDSCVEKVEREIGVFEFDESYCGERLEENY